LRLLRVRKIDTRGAKGLLGVQKVSSVGAGRLQGVRKITSRGAKRLGVDAGATDRHEQPNANALWASAVVLAGCVTVVHRNGLDAQDSWLKKADANVMARANFDLNCMGAQGRGRRQVSAFVGRDTWVVEKIAAPAVQPQ
jgi:hypothetical protein